jgi:catechol 2,3-dioxygenase-like lactoylglutathione lyase family enzyme
MENDWKFDHVAFVVKDMDKAIEFYQSLDMVACFQPWGCILQKGAFVMELHKLPPAEGASSGLRRVLRDFYDRHGEGIWHIHFSVDNMEKEKAKMIEKGFPLVFSSNRPDGSLMEAFYDTYKVGNVSIAMFSEPMSIPLLRPQKSCWKFDHVGFVVKDMDKAVEFYQSLGMVVLGPLVEEVWDDKRSEVYGKAPVTTIKNKWRLLQKGSFVIELHQPVEGESVHKEFLERHGEGVEHIHFTVDDMEKETAKMAEKGFPVINSVKKPDSSGLVDAYFDTRKVGNVIIALMHMPIMEYLAKVTKKEFW